MPNGKTKVLLVEDDIFMATILAEGFAREGMEAVVAKNAEEAIRRYTESKPGILLIDILLPGKNGLEVLREIRGLPGGADVPALILSNVEEAAYVREAESLGVKGYLVKANLQVPEIVARVKEALAEGV